MENILKRIIIILSIIFSLAIVGTILYSLLFPEQMVALENILIKIAKDCPNGFGFSGCKR